jgi:hypothetical protein
MRAWCIVIAFGLLFPVVSSPRDLDESREREEGKNLIVNGSFEDGHDAP